MHYFLGIDVGTYSSKGVLTDESGKVVSRAVTHHGMENPEPGYYEQDADKVWWNDFCILSKMLLQQSGVEPEKIACVGEAHWEQIAFQLIRTGILYEKQFYMVLMHVAWKKWSISHSIMAQKK